MALPESYSDPKSYFYDCLQFLKDYQWIYNYPNTHILVNNIFEKIPKSWIEYFNNFNSTDLNNLALGIVEDTAPISLKEFLYKLKKLKPKMQSNICSEKDCFNFPKNISMGIKKRHEILCLSSVLDRVCKEMNVETVVDVGCGLGYLPHLLNEKYKYKIIGVEGDGKKVKLAETYQKKYYPHSLGDVAYLHHYITKDSLDVLNKIVLDNVCITGLHACADLSITILELFLKMPSAKCLVIMPCCYHRLTTKWNTSDIEVFDNFPCSNVLKDVARDFKTESFLRRPFLRLAAQQSNESWKEMDDHAHDVHAKNCLFRAILQEIAEEGGYELRRLKRKSGKSLNSKDFDAETFANNLAFTHSFASSNRPVDCSEIRVAFLAKWNNYRRHLALTEALTSLQTAVQIVCENLILFDRVEYLNENHLRVSVYKVTDERLSPRCYALLATKH